MKRAEAEPIVKAMRRAVLGKVCPTHQDDPLNIYAVGSYARAKYDVKDLDFIAAMPTDYHERYDSSDERAKINPDPLYERLAELFRSHTDSLYEDGGPRPIGVPISGLRRGFLEARLQLDITRLTGGGGKIVVEIARYWPGSLTAQTNAGWVALRKIGPEDFGRRILKAWKHAHGIPRSGAGSVNGWLVDGQGRRVSTPTQDDIFEAIGAEPVPEHERTADVRIRRARCAR